MTACTSFLAFFAEQMLAFAGKMHSRPGRCPSKARRAEVASTRSEAQCAATERRASVSAGRCVDKRPGNPRPQTKGLSTIREPLSILRDSGSDAFLHLTAW